MAGLGLDDQPSITYSRADPEDDLWTFALPDRRSMGKAMEFMVPYIADKNSWPYPPDVKYFDPLPFRQPSLVFARPALAQPECLQLWRGLIPDPTIPEVIRNWFIRQQVLWVSSPHEVHKSV